MIITAAKNEFVKGMRELKDKKARRETGLHFIEGERLVFDASLYVKIKMAFVEEGHTKAEEFLAARDIAYRIVSRSVMETVCDTKTPQYICAAAVTPRTDPPDNGAYPRGMLVALDELNDPGNLGTIIRTADAMGASGILLSRGCTDPFSPKALRAAMGSTYHIPIWIGDIENELLTLKKNGYALICGHLNGKNELPDFDNDCVIVIGNEARGVSSAVAEKCMLYCLPMKGKAESLNASVAASLIIYEASKRINS